MSRGSFGRSVARAAASGGGKAYRSRPPVLWYLSLIAICVAGVGLIVYSRNERLHPHVAASKPKEGPTGSDHWYAAYAIDVCGVVEAPLPANSNLTSVGIRTFGNGLIDINPSVVKTPADYEGAKATLGLFASSYPKFTLTATSVELPATHPVVWKDGDHCAAHGGDAAGAGSLKVEVWSSPDATGKVLATDPLDLHLANGQMITIAFVTPGSVIPVPPSRSTLITTIGFTPTTTTLAKPSTTTTSSVKSSTTTTSVTTAPTTTTAKSQKKKKT